MIYHLLYRSFSQTAMPETTLNSILRQSQENNLRLSLSGLLLYKNRTFLQLLEGDEKNVKKVYQKILDDKRHVFPELLMTATSDHRIFEDWNMGHIPESQISNDFHIVPKLIELVEANQKCDHTVIFPLIQSFVKTNIRTLKF